MTSSSPLTLSVSAANSALSCLISSSVPVAFFRSTLSQKASTSLRHSAKAAQASSTGVSCSLASYPKVFPKRRGPKPTPIVNASHQPSFLALSLASFQALARNSAEVMGTRGSQDLNGHMYAHTAVSPPAILSERR
jgi:hypothetical protein